MTDHYFAIGASLAALKNVEIDLTYAPHALPSQRVPLIAPVRRATLDRAIQRNGSINAVMQWDILAQSALAAYIVATWGNYTTASKALFASWLDESGHYSPFAVTLERPVEGEHYTSVNDAWARDVQIPGYGWTLQSATKSANYTVTTSDRLLYADTSGGSITFTLPAAATPNPYTVFSFVKTSASNNMVLGGDGSETIDGNSTLTKTALNARVDLYSDGSAWYTV